MADILNSINLDGSNSSNSLIFSNELSGGSSSTVSFVGEVNGDSSEVKIKNRKASLDDKSRTLQKGDPGFESAVRVYDKYKETENPTTPPNSGNVALGKENTVKIGRT